MIDITKLLAGVRKASRKIKQLTNLERNDFLAQLAKELRLHVEKIIVANAKDLELKSAEDPMRDRLMLNQTRIEFLAQSIEKLMELPQPDNKIVSSFIKENNLKINKISVPLGVVSAIYESRPNVTIDVIALCIKSGNACVLKGGSDAKNTNQYFEKICHELLLKNNLPVDAIIFYPTDREYLSTLLKAERYIDVIIPRGSAGLINYVKEHSIIPTIETGAGVCHTYVSQHADLKMACEIVVNAKTTRPSVCNSLDTIIIHELVVNDFIKEIEVLFIQYKIEIFADIISFKILHNINYPYLQSASIEDFGREFLDLKCSIKVVKSLEEALDHIDQHSSRHSEAIVSENNHEIDRFLSDVDSAAVYANASTRFTDGFEFGLGAEIGISTQKLHARGPFALEKLVCEKWIGIGQGQIR
jgi:glutamate-5-semialdehyde dehydrogenase